MKYDAVGSYLPPMNLVEAREAHADPKTIAKLEDEAVRDIIEHQIAAGLPSVTSGEVRRTSWDKDFYSGLRGIKIEHVDSGGIYQSVCTYIDVLKIESPIEYNPNHQFYESFEFLRDYVGNRARCRQTLPSPTDLYFDIVQAANWNLQAVYPTPDTLISDIARAYKQTAQKFYDLGCRDLLFDDTVLAQLCDSNFTARLILAGVDLQKLASNLLNLLNESVAGLPEDMEVKLYMSGGTNVVPEWSTINYPDNPLKEILPKLQYHAFFLPFNPGDTSAMSVLKLLPAGSEIVLGLISAHSPYPDDVNAIEASINAAMLYATPEHLVLGPQCGFKMTHFIMRGLVYDVQWEKLRILSKIAHKINI